MYLMKLHANESCNFRPNQFYQVIFVAVKKKTALNIFSVIVNLKYVSNRFRGDVVIWMVMFMLKMIIKLTGLPNSCWSAVLCFTDMP